MKIEVSASILSADFGKVAEALALCERAGVDRIHVDVMDGHFVPTITIGPIFTAAVRKYTRLPVAVHLMIENPWDHIDAFLEAGADMIAVHAECYGPRRAGCLDYGQFPKEVDLIDPARLARDLARISSGGRRAGVTVNPGTPVECLWPVLDQVDSILVMSVNPGFSGQKFMPVALEKVACLRARGFRGDIAVDGGVNAATAPGVVDAGANVLVTASYFFASADQAAAVGGLKRLGEKSRPVV